MVCAVSECDALAGSSMKRQIRKNRVTPGCAGEARLFRNFQKDTGRGFGAPARITDQMVAAMDLNTSVARSLEEGTEETLTVHKLRVPDHLGQRSI